MEGSGDFTRGNKKMIHLTSETEIMLASKSVDFRFGIDGLAGLCEYELKQNPRDGKMFVFFNRNGTKIRILVYELNGFWLMTKRLSKGRFELPKKGESITAIRAEELRKLLSGICISEFKKSK